MNGVAALILALGLAAAPDLAKPPWELIWQIGPRKDAPTKPPRSTPALRARGQSLYDARCAGCHGALGDGRGPLAAQLRPSPTNFSRGVFKLRSTPTGTLPTDQDLYVTLSRGLHGTAMQPWRDLPPRDRWALVFHLKSLVPRYRHEAPGVPVRVPIAPRETDDIRDHGERLYVQLRCGVCHGDAGAGDGPARAAYLAQRDRHVRIRDFTRRRFIRGAEMEDLFVTLRVGVEGTPMGAYDALSDDELWALAAYVRLLVRERPLHELPPAGDGARQSGPSPGAIRGSLEGLHGGQD